MKNHSRQQDWNFQSPTPATPSKRAIFCSEKFLAMAPPPAELPETEPAEQPGVDARPGTTAEALTATEYPAEDCAVCFEVLGEAGLNCLKVKVKAVKLHLFKLGRFLSWFQWKLSLSLVFSWEACPVRKLSCGHSFHHACIAEWLLRRASCPLCKSALGLKIYRILQMGEQGMNSKSHHGFLIYLNRQPGLAYIVAVFASAYFLPVFMASHVATLGRILDIQ